MMAGIYLGGKHIQSAHTVDFFLLMNNYRYHYIYTKSFYNKYTYQQGAKSYCSTGEMVHAAPLKLVSWEW